MKKLLSILASVGLVATASTSVVSCTKKVELVSYNDYHDIRNWNLVSDNEIIPVDADKVLNLGQDYDGNEYKINDDIKDMVIGTLAWKFKDSDKDKMINDLKNGEKNNKFHLAILSDATQVVKTEDGKFKSAVYKVAFGLDATKMEDTSQKTLALSTSFMIKVGSKENFNELGTVNPMTLDLTNTGSNSLINTIDNLRNEMKHEKPDKLNDYIQIKSESSELMNMDWMMFNDLANYQNKDGMIMVPRLDEKTGIRYQSIQQEIIAKYSSKNLLEQKKDNFREFNGALVDFNKIVLNNIEKHINDHDGFANKVIRDSISNPKNPLNTKDGFTPFTIQGDK